MGIKGYAEQTLMYFQDNHFLLGMFDPECNGATSSALKKGQF